MSKSKPPSLRDLNVYQEAVSAGAAQQDVALKYGVSQPRVSQIVAGVGDWVAQVLGDDHPAASPATAFALALAEERIRLADDCDPQAKWIRGPNDASRVLDALLFTLKHCESLLIARQEIERVRSLVEKAARLVELETVAERTVYADVPHQVRAASEAATSTDPPYMGVSNASNGAREVAGY